MSRLLLRMALAVWSVIILLMMLVPFGVLLAWICGMYVPTELADRMAVSFFVGVCLFLLTVIAYVLWE